MGSEPEERFDRIVRLAASVFNVPIAFFTIVGRDSQWLKSRHGIDVQESPRDMAFCPYVVDSDSPLVIKDAREDPRFASNLLVTGGPRIRFYAGHPVKSPDGAVIGTLCVADRRSWASFSDQQTSTLRDLASLVESELILHSESGHETSSGGAHQTLSAVRLRALLDDGSAGKIVLDDEQRVVAFNARATDYIALNGDSIGRPINDAPWLLEYRSLSQDLQDATDRGHESKQKVTTISGKLVVVRLTPFRPPQATRYHMVISVTDVTASRDAELLATVLDGVGNRVCAVDRNGVILYTNCAWDAHADSKSVPPLVRAGPGANYLDLALARPSPQLKHLIDRLQAVIQGEQSSVNFRYEWSNGEATHIVLIHACAVSYQNMTAVISHTDITDFLDESHSAPSELPPD
jgi:PAS domain-containing protein